MGTDDKPDDNDRIIINLLRENARSSLREIAKDVTIICKEPYRASGGKRFCQAIHR
ncbi:MAG: winged helix-turn-helix transcriptional regulator [Candidatus Thorarchaeota archaeon]